MKKVFFFLALATGLLNVQAQMSVTIAGSATGSGLSTPVATAATLHNGFGASCNNTAFGNVNNDGSISTTVTGGAASHSYELYAGNTATGSPLATNTTGNFPALVGSNAGTPYTVKITDAGCPPVTAATVNVTAPPTLTASVSQTTPDNCQANGGVATVTIAGGVANYTFATLGTPVANSPFTGTPATPVIATPTGSALTNTATGLSGNSTYSFQITDANGCVVQ